MEVGIEVNDLGGGLSGLTITLDGEYAGLMGTVASTGFGTREWSIYTAHGEPAIASGRNSMASWRAAVRTAAIQHLAKGGQ